MFIIIGASSPVNANPVACVNTFVRKTDTENSIKSDKVKVQYTHLIAPNAQTYDGIYIKEFKCFWYCV